MNNNFYKDLADGQKGEEAVKHFGETVLDLRFVKYNDTSAFDILFEDDERNVVTFEVKTDFFEKNLNEGGTGNMAIEYKCRGKRSGIRKTKAMYFVYYFPNINDKQLWLISVDDLKSLLKEHRFKRVSAGETYYDNDEKVAKCFLIDRYRYKRHFDIYSWDGGRWLASSE
jgi:hypothetical protein